MSAKTITVNLRVWRQPSKDQPGRLVDYVAKDISTDMSFLEMLDVVNEDLIRKGEDAIAFDSDCREGICGACGCMINGVAHGPDAGTTTCQLHMRRFTDGQTIVVEPWRAKAFPVLKDLTVDRSRRSIASSPRAATSRRVSAERRTRTASSFPKSSPTERWIRRRASAAARAWRPARMRRRTCLPAPRSRTSRFCRRESPSASSASCAWSSRWKPKDSGTARTKANAKPSARS